MEVLQADPADFIACRRKGEGGGGGGRGDGHQGCGKIEGIALAVAQCMVQPSNSILPGHLTLLKQICICLA